MRSFKNVGVKSIKTLNDNDDNNTRFVSRHGVITGAVRNRLYANYECDWMQTFCTL